MKRRTAVLGTAACLWGALTGVGWANGGARGPAPDKFQEQGAEVRPLGPSLNLAPASAPKSDSERVLFELNRSLGEDKLELSEIPQIGGRFAAEEDYRARAFAAHSELQRIELLSERLRARMRRWRAASGSDDPSLLIQVLEESAAAKNALVILLLRPHRRGDLYYTGALNEASQQVFFHFFEEVSDIFDQTLEARQGLSARRRQEWVDRLIKH